MCYGYILIVVMIEEGEKWWLWREVGGRGTGTKEKEELGVK